MKRCLVLILAVDVVRYSCLVEIDEEFALSLLGVSLRTIDEVVWPAPKNRVQVIS